MNSVNSRQSESLHRVNHPGGNEFGTLVLITDAEARPQTVTRHSRLMMQPPATAQICTAIEVVRNFGEHINHIAANLVVPLPDKQFSDHRVARVEALRIAQISRTQTLAAQLKNWRDQ